MPKNKGNKDCCCDGCHSKITSGGHGEHQLRIENVLNAFCCKCIPNEICVFAGDYHKRLYRYCEAQPNGTPGNERLVYSGSILINGLDTDIEFWLKESNDKCYFCLKSDDLGYDASVPGDCNLIDQSDTSTDPYCEHGRDFQAINFCQDFIASWTIDTTYYGDGSSTSTTISTTKVDNLSLDKRIGCGGNCKCICKCVCFSVYKRKPASEDPTFTFTGNTENVCGTIIDDVEKVCGGTIPAPSYVKWERSDGWAVVLSGDGQPRLNETKAVKGTENSDSCSVSERIKKYNDGHQLIVSADSGNEIEYHQYFKVQSGEHARKINWIGKVTGSGQTLKLYFWNAGDSAWDLIDTYSGTDSPTNEFRTLQIESKYTDANGNFKIKWESANVASLVQDLFRVYSGDCCKLKLVPPGDVVIDESFGKNDPVSIDFPNDCPDPSASWNLTDYDGNEYRISYECSMCGDCVGVNGDPGCCDGQTFNRILTASISPDCYECSDFTVPLIYDGTAWTYETNSHPCFGYVFVSWSPCHNLQIQLNACGPANTPAKSSVCEPLRDEYRPLLGGIGCCNGVGFSTYATVVVTE